MASQLAEAYVTVSANASQFPGQLSGIKSQLASAIGDMANRFAMTGFVFRRLIDMGKEFALAIAEDEEEVLKFQGAMQAAGRGEYYENMVKQIGEASEATTKFSADSVRAAGTAIARFSTLGDDTLGQVINAAKDLSAQFGGDLTSNATKLAMAMERPEMGMRMLRSMQVNLTAEQANGIKELMKAGRTSEASMMILEIASGKASGAAQRLGGTLMSLWARMKTELSELSEAMGGKMISGLKAFGEFAIKALRSIRDLIEGDSIVGKIAAMAGSFLGLASAGGTLIQVFSTIKGLLFGTLGPIGWIIAGAVALGTQFVSVSDIIAGLSSVWQTMMSWWERSKPLIDGIKISFGMLADTVRELIARIFDIPDWSGWWETIQEWAGKAATAVLNFTKSAIEAIHNFIADADLYWDLFKVKAEESVLSVVKYFQDNWPKVTSTIVGVVAAIKEATADALLVLQYLLDKVGEQLEKHKVSLAMLAPQLAILNDIVGNMSSGQGGSKAAQEAATLALLGPLGMLGYGGTARQAREESERQASQTATKRLSDLKSKEDALNSQLDAKQRDRELERAKKLKEMQDKEAGAALLNFVDYVEKLKGGKGAFEGQPGGKPGKEEKEEMAKVSAGFVGVAEYAKQFQSAILNDAAERAAKETARNTARSADALERMEENEEGGVFGAT